MRLKWKENDITKYVTSVTWSGSARQAARTVAFSVAYSPNDKSVETLDIKLGDKIVFYPDSNQKVHFFGAVTERNRSSDAGELQYTAKDHMIHLLRSNGTYRFRNKTPEKITEMVCKDIGINVRNLAKTGLVLNKMFFQERPYYEIIMAAYTKVYRKNKKPYIAQMNGDTLEVIEKGKTIPGFHIKQGERILESSYSENMDDMVNRVYVYNSSNKKIGILTNTRWANMYGIFQSAITVDSGNGKQEAMNELKGISKNASLTSTGDYRCVSGLGVIIEDSRTGLKGRFWIESDSHEWKNGSYTMKLDLEFKNIMDTQEEDEEQTSSSLSDLSESSALEDVLNQARSWIGIGENPPGSNHNEITVLYGMDAAWCCMFIWACFNKSGHADLFMGGAKEAYCFNVRDYYQARGKWGSTPKKGALVIYGGQGHIGIVESVNSAGGYTSIEGNYGDDVKRRDSHQNVLGFCYIDYPVTKSAEGSDEVISGTTVAVPGSVAQTGIIKDYTNYSYFFGRWNSGSTQKIIADLWENNGKQGKNGIATINGYYLIALRPVFGSAGDVVSVVLEDGARFNAIIADEKGDDAGNQWGHVYSGAVSIVEGVDALMVWCWIALHTPRYRYYIYSDEYGQEFEDLIGKQYSEGYTNSELERMTEECLCVNPYIEGITDFECVKKDEKIMLSFKLITTLGEQEAEIYV